MFVLGFLCVVVFGLGWVFFVGFFFYYAGSKGSGLAGFFWSDMILTVLSNVLNVQKILGYEEK